MNTTTAQRGKPIRAYTSRQLTEDLLNDLCQPKETFRAKKASMILEAWKPKLEIVAVSAEYFDRPWNAVQQATAVQTTLGRNVRTKSPLEKTTREHAEGQDYLEDSRELIAELRRYYWTRFTSRIAEIHDGEPAFGGELGTYEQGAEEILDAVQAHQQRLEDVFMSLPSLDKLAEVLSVFVMADSGDIAEIEIAWSDVHEHLGKKLDEYKDRDAIHEWWKLTTIFHDALKEVAASYPQHAELQAELAKEFDGFKLLSIARKEAKSLLLDDDQLFSFVTFALVQLVGSEEEPSPRDVVESCPECTQKPDLYRKDTKYRYDRQLSLDEYVRQQLPRFVERLKYRNKKDALTSALRIVSDPENEKGVTPEAIEERPASVTFANLPAQRKRVKNKRIWKSKRNGYFDLTDSEAMPVSVTGHGETSHESEVLDQFRDLYLTEEDRPLLDSVRAGFTKKETAELHALSIDALSKKFERAIAKRKTMLDTPDRQAERESVQAAHIEDAERSFDGYLDWTWQGLNLESSWAYEAGS